jgi:hypothetical protein
VNCSGDLETKVSPCHIQHDSDHNPYYTMSWEGDQTISCYLCDDKNLYVKISFYDDENEEHTFDLSTQMNKAFVKLSEHMDDKLFHVTRKGDVVQVEL